MMSKLRLRLLLGGKPEHMTPVLAVLLVGRALRRRRIGHARWTKTGSSDGHKARYLSPVADLFDLFCPPIFSIGSDGLGCFCFRGGHVPSNV